MALRPAAARVVVPSARSPVADAEAAIRALALGAAAVVLLLSGAAAGVAGGLGGRWVAIAAALDPALPGSLPDLLVLSTAFVALVPLGGRAPGFAHLRLGSSPPERRLGRTLVARLAVWGSAAGPLDLRGSAVGSRGLGTAASHGVDVAEGVVELLLHFGFSADLADGC
jgi:hypothetical protein